MRLEKPTEIEAWTSGIRIVQVPPAAAGPAAAGGDDEAPGSAATQAAAEAPAVLPQKRPAGAHAAAADCHTMQCKAESSVLHMTHGLSVCSGSGEPCYADSAGPLKVARLGLRCTSFEMVRW